MYILVVDDKPNVISLLTQLLEKFDCRVDSASNGLDAFEKAQKIDFDLYIIDHLMPVMDGLSLVKNLKKKVSTASTPILFMTTQSLPSVEQLVEYPLFDGLLAKPIDSKTLYEAVNQLMAKNSLRYSL
jgi:CheY-like chemotaxis protein